MCVLLFFVLAFVRLWLLSVFISAVSWLASIYVFYVLFLCLTQSKLSNSCYSFRWCHLHFINVSLHFIIVTNERNKKERKREIVLYCVLSFFLLSGDIVQQKIKKESNKPTTVVIRQQIDEYTMPYKKCSRKYKIKSIFAGLRTFLRLVFIYVTPSLKSTKKNSSGKKKNKAHGIEDIKRRHFTMQYVTHHPVQSDDNNTWRATWPEPKRVSTNGTIIQC